MLKEREDGKPPTLLAQAPLIVTAALGAEGESMCTLCASFSIHLCFPDLGTAVLEMTFIQSGVWGDMVSY